MLRRAFTKMQILQLGRAGAAQRNADAAGGVAGSPFFLRRGNVFERDFDALGLFGAAADGLDEASELFFAGRLFQH